MPSERCVVAVTGADGFIGRNLVVRLGERGHAVHPIVRDTPAAAMRAMVSEAGVVVHLAAANRPADPADFMRVNRDWTAALSSAITESGRRPLVIFASSIKATQDTPYGCSKAASEVVLLDLAAREAARVAIFRLPNVFGKWARPGYNSAVATFCHNIARGLPIRIDDPAAPLDLLHVDDLIDQWLALIDDPPGSSGITEPASVNRTTVGAVAALLRHFAEQRAGGRLLPAAPAFARALYGTFAAALPVEEFSYPLDAQTDARGSFVEMLKDPQYGQISCFTAHPGMTRGGHYHHAKVEKFFVAHGTARFRLRNVLTGERHEIVASADRPTVVETVPGWMHDITNVGEDLLVVLLWANEVFDPARPDTVAAAP